MGIFHLSSVHTPGDPIRPGNPDPSRFTVVKTEQCGRNLVAWIRYEGVSNYEGDKILVFLNRDAESLNGLTWLDPHFDDKSDDAPFARFEPTQRGWYSAIGMLDAW